MPARTRKPAAAKEDVAAEVAPVVEDDAPPSDPSDPRIGDSVDDDALFVAFDDGSEYRCEGGVIVERVN